MDRTKKSLGQNFLKSNIALKKIIEAGEISPGDIILEIGPGKGALTEKLLEKVYPEHGRGTGYVIAVEKDRALVKFLKEKFAKEILEKKLILIEDDILKFDTKQIEGKSGEFSSWSGSKPRTRENSAGLAENYKIIANIPYSITGAILKKFLQGNLSTPLKARNQPSLMVLMVQNEVAKRIIARDGKESLLSISVKAYGEPKMIMKVPARYFSPVPKVDSAVILIKNISRKLFTSLKTPLSFGHSPLVGGEKVVEEKFWKIVRAGFAHKRKKLSSNLKNLQVHTGYGHGVELGNKRAEDLSLEDWISLAKN
jgi:16S rRNA (adenine1518-N6/adenine1519-N6)-dimethyltransferase